MRRAREGRETKRVSFSLRNCMFATLHVALTTRGKIVDCPTAAPPDHTVHPISPVRAPAPPPALNSSRGHTAPLGCTHSRLPTGPLRTACWEPRMHPRAALDEHLLLDWQTHRISPVEHPRRRCAHVWKMRLSSRSWHWCAASRRGAELAAPDEGSNHWSSVDISGRGITRGRGAEPAAPAQPSCITSALRRATSLTTSD